MGKGQDICDRTFVFAAHIIRLCRDLNKQAYTDYVLTRQLLRAGTSVGANVEEARAGQSNADFVNKYSIALKEARETKYWLRLLVAAECVPELIVAGLIIEADEIARVIAAIIISARKRNST